MTTFLRHKTSLTTQTSGQFTVNANKAAHIFSEYSHAYEDISCPWSSPNTHALSQTHTTSQTICGKKKKKTALRDKSAHMDANSGATLALWNSPPEHSASSSTNKPPTRKLTYSEQRLAPKLPLKCSPVTEKKQNTKYRQPRLTKKKKEKKN